MEWPNYNRDVIMALEEVKGDSIVFNVMIDGLDLTGYKIRAELYDLNMSIKLATLNAGGTDAEIAIVNGPSAAGSFVVNVPWGATGTAQKYGFIEIEIEDLHGSRFTIFQQEILFINERIIWNSPV